MERTISEKITSSGTTSRGSGDLLVARLHSTMVTLGCACVAECPVPGAQVIPGFAPPMEMRDVTDEEFLPPSWQSSSKGADGDGTCSLSYRVRGESEERITMETRRELTADPGPKSVHVSFESKSKRGIKKSVSLELSIEEHSGMEEVQSMEILLEMLRDDVLPSLVKVLPSANDACARHNQQGASQSKAVGLPTQVQALAEETRSMEAHSHQAPNKRAPPPALPDPVPRVPAAGSRPQAPAFPVNGPTPGLFDGDLFPGGHGGNLLGPSHPAFMGGQPPSMLPQPRFDPYGPPMPGLGPMPGQHPQPHPGLMDPRDPRHGGFAGRRPNHDHLQPPGFDSSGGPGFPDTGPPPGMFF